MVCGPPDVRRVLRANEGNLSETLLAGPGTTEPEDVQAECDALFQDTAWRRPSD